MRNPVRPAFAVLLALGLLGGCGTAAPAPAKEGTMMSDLERLAACKPRSATLILVEEALLTRSRITAASAASHAPPVDLKAGDPRLARLQAILAALKIAPSTMAEIDPRTLVSLTCADGTAVSLTGSATEDGRMYLMIGDSPALTETPLRRQLEALLSS